jgi:hypothetical protein
MIELKNGTDVLKLLDDPGKQWVWHAKIYPGAARALLDLNTHNRTVTEARVETLSRSMREGRWLLINNGIGVDVNGDLTDGQHRLLAVVLSDIPVEFYIHTGLDPKTRTVIDTGRARTLADTLAITGFGHGQSNLAAAARLLYRYENDLLVNTVVGGLPHDVLLEYIQTSLNYELLSRVDLFAQGASRQIPGSNRSALTAAAYLFSERDVFDSNRFLERLRTGAGLSSGNAELCLRGVLARLGKDRRNNTWHLCIYIKAWNAFRTEKEVHALAYRVDELVPEVR